VTGQVELASPPLADRHPKTPVIMAGSGLLKIH
jgi:hypothetical protein